MHWRCATGIHRPLLVLGWLFRKLKAPLDAVDTRFEISEPAHGVNFILHQGSHVSVADTNFGREVFVGCRKLTNVGTELPKVFEYDVRGLLLSHGTHYTV